MSTPFPTAPPAADAAAPRHPTRLPRWLFTALLAFWAFNALAEFFFHGRNFVRRLRSRHQTPR